MNWLLALVAAIVGGVVTFVIQRVIDLRLTRAHSSELEMLAAEARKRWEAIYELRGDLREIQHCVMHVTHGLSVREYRDRGGHACMRARRGAREAVVVLGEAIVEEVHQTTQAALDFFESPDEGSGANQWRALSADLVRALDHALDLRWPPTAKSKD